MVPGITQASCRQAGLSVAHAPLASLHCCLDHDLRHDCHFPAADLLNCVHCILAPEPWVSLEVVLKCCRLLSAHQVGGKHDHF